VPLDDLGGAPEVADPRLRLKPQRAHGRTVIPLTQQPGGIQARKIRIPASRIEPELRVHEGHEWLYVLTGRMRLLLGRHDLVLGSGEAAEFDTHVPHWFGSRGDESTEVLSLFGQQGERMDVRATQHRDSDRVQGSKPTFGSAELMSSAQNLGVAPSLWGWLQLWLSPFSGAGASRLFSLGVTARSCDPAVHDWSSSVAVPDSPC
jgi:mannose-6-phosphate isomerase-like protein (cupin superfamily)